MSSYIQLGCLIVSFLYGLLINILSKLVYKIHRRVFLFIILTVLLLFFICGSYVFILYYLNYGIFHFYFGLCMVFGFILYDVKCRK